MGFFSTDQESQDVRVALGWAEKVDGGETKVVILEVADPKIYLSVYQLEQLITHLSHILDRARVMPETSAEAEKLYGEEGPPVTSVDIYPEPEKAS